METAIQWVDVKGFSNYEISEYGVKNKRNGKLLKLRLQNGYLSVKLCKDGEQKNKGYYFHRLIAIQFIPNPHNLATVNHINGNKLDNSIGNLEWCSAADNLRHGWRTGLLKGHPCGEAHPSAKLTNAQVEEIRDSKEPAKFLAAKYKVCHSHILCIRRGAKRNASHFSLQPHRK